MKAVILAGGLGTRLSEETKVRPKPMVEIGGRPILWHIMKNIAAYGISEFIICCGYKGHVIKEYFYNQFIYSADVTFDYLTKNTIVHHQRVDPWKVTLVDTGEDSMTGGRLLRVEEYLTDEEPFLFTYGDGLADIDIARLRDFHTTHGKLATVTATRPPGRFGALSIQNGSVTSFIEKPVGDGDSINGGFFILDPRVLKLIEGDQTVWEKYPMEELARSSNLMAYEHEGFWMPMDSLRDKESLEDLWAAGRAPWKVWAE